MSSTAKELAPRTLMLGVVAAGLVLAAFYVPDPRVGVLLLGSGLILAVFALIIRVLLVWQRLKTRRMLKTVSAFVDHDNAPGFVTDRAGEVKFRNHAAAARFKESAGKTLTFALKGLFANPSAVLFRLQNKALALGSACEDVVTRRGHIRLSVHQIDPDGFLWRLEELAERTINSRGAETLSLPMMTASKTGTVLFMNEAFRKLIGGRVRSLDRVFANTPIKNGEFQDVSTRSGKIQCLVSDIEGVGGRREIYLLPGVEKPAEIKKNLSSLEDIPVALLKISSSGAVILSNGRARKLIGQEIAADTPLDTLFEGLGRLVSDWVADTLAQRGVKQTEVLRAKSSDRELFVQVTLCRVIENGEPVLIGVLNDATELKTLEAQFVQSQKMQAIGQLAGGIAHDFNNLLTAISGHCDLLLLRHDQGDPDFADLVQINQNANRAASLVSQLLAFSRKQNLRLETIDIRDTLADLTHLLNRLVGERIDLTLTHDSGLPPIRADKRQLEQVIMNLVVNARDAMPAGGEIKIETQSMTLRDPMHRDRVAVPPGDYVVVMVSDEGAGIPAENLSKIFEPFYTTKRTGEGTGLGLSTAYGIVKQTGGFIFVDSVPGTGSQFRIYFPAAEAVPDQPQPVQPVPKMHSLKKGDGVVLLVEDEAPVRAFASRALRMQGFTVLEADCAEMALKTLEDNSLNVDVFVTDVIMPGMDGPNWVRKALVDRPDAKVVFVSGYAEANFSNDQSKIPNSVFLPKPFSLSELTNTVQEQLH